MFSNKYKNTKNSTLAAVVCIATQFFLAVSQESYVLQRITLLQMAWEVSVSVMLVNNKGNSTGARRDDPGYTASQRTVALKEYVDNQVLMSEIKKNIPCLRYFRFLFIITI